MDLAMKLYLFYVIVIALGCYVNQYHERKEFDRQTNDEN